MNYKYGLSLIALVSVFILPISQAHADVPAPCMGYYQTTLRAAALSSETGGVSDQNGVSGAQQQLTQCEQNYASQGTQTPTYQSSVTYTNTSYVGNPSWAYVVGTYFPCKYVAVYDSNKNYDILKWDNGQFPNEKDMLYGTVSGAYGWDYMQDNGVSSTYLTVLSGLSVSQAAYDVLGICNPPNPTYQTTISAPVKTYVNTAGNTVLSPTYTRYAGATAMCRDGSYSYSQSSQGTCSGHGGVSVSLHS